MSPAPHVVVAELEARPGHREAFTALATAFAAQCLAREPGCRQFQVVALAEAPQALLFFEVYDSPAAFEAHGRSDHLARFQQAFAGMVHSARPLHQGTLADRP